MDSINNGYFDERNLSDYEFEFVRELAGQIAGYEPSEMWGRLTREIPKHNPYYYEQIMDAESQQSLHGLGMIHGGSFGDVLRHVLHVGSQIVKGASKASNYLSRNPYLYKHIPLLNMVDPSILKVTSDLLNPVGDLMQKGADAFPQKKRKLNNGTSTAVTNTGEVHKTDQLDVHKNKVEFESHNKINNDMVTTNPISRIQN